MSPTKKPNRASPLEKTMADGVIAHFIVANKVEILGLCEVSAEDITKLKTLCATHGYGLVDGIPTGKGVKLDCCVIYRISSFKAKATKIVATPSTRARKRIGLHIIFEILSTAETLHIFVSHWPSVRWINKGTAVRLSYGIDLRKVVSEIWENDPEALLVLMGDYNDEPFDEPLAFNLEASRDASFVYNKPKCLYNPFWRRLGCIRGYSRNNSTETYAGTYFYKVDKVDRWRTYDQIIFSSEFLGRSQWHLDEASVGIVDIPQYTKVVLEKSMIFDHFPITATIEQ